MSQANSISAVRSAIVAVGFLGLVAAGIAARGDAPADAVSLGAADDYGTRHPAAAAPADEGTTSQGMTHGKLVLAPALSLADDFATRHAVSAQVAQLGPADDFATRHAVSAQVTQLGPADDFGTRHAAAAAPKLGLNDDYGTRNAR